VEEEKKGDKKLATSRQKKMSSSFSADKRKVYVCTKINSGRCFLYRHVKSTNTVYPKLCHSLHAKRPTAIGTELQVKTKLLRDNITLNLYSIF
jgi:hypothetical protein